MISMKLKELRPVVAKGVTLWVQDKNEKCLESNEVEYLSNKYDECEIAMIYNDCYPAISSRGITVELKEGVEELDR